ncbi:MAG: patatin family protein [Eubacterium sp.]|nr:patatin family protein [Eubacterium sp.]
MAKKMKVYSKVAEIPTGNAPDVITEGCLVLEGGAWRGLYTQGALDVLMEHGINFQTTIGVSAGAMSATGYVSGQIGFCPRINLTHRHDPEYTGMGAVKKEHGVTGFTYLFDTLMGGENPLNRARFDDPARRLVAVATNVLTGEPYFFEKGECNIFRAIQASATVPYVSRPVVIGGQPYLDGGCSVKIPYDYAVQEGHKKIMVIRTQDRTYRRKEKKENAFDKVLYGRHPAFIRAMEKASTDYNEVLDRMDADMAEGRCFVLAPSRPVGISRFESDVEKIGALYELGRADMEAEMEALKTYLG